MNGLITVTSVLSFRETLARLEVALEKAGLTLFAVFDHAEGAEEAELSLGPTTVLVFGNPAAGTKLMQANQEAGIDLPLKILVWQADGAVRVTYNDPHWIAERHGLDATTDPVITVMANFLTSLAGSLSAPAAPAA